MSLSEKLSHHNSDEKNNGITRPSNETPESPEQKKLIDLVRGANFLDFPRVDRREVSRIYRNGGPEHLMTVSWKKGIMGESVYVHAHGEKGPTVIDVADYKGLNGDQEDRLGALWIKGKKGEGVEDIEEAVVHLEEIFPSYSILTENYIDGEGNRYVDGVLHKDGLPPNVNIPSNGEVALTSGESASLAS